MARVIARAMEITAGMCAEGWICSEGVTTKMAAMTARCRSWTGAETQVKKVSHWRREYTAIYRVGWPQAGTAAPRPFPSNRPRRPTGQSQGSPLAPGGGAKAGRMSPGAVACSGIRPPTRYITRGASSTEIRSMRTHSMPSLPAAHRGERYRRRDQPRHPATLRPRLPAAVVLPVHRLQRQPGPPHRPPQQHVHGRPCRRPCPPGRPISDLPLRRPPDQQRQHHTFATWSPCWTQRGSRWSSG